MKQSIFIVVITTIFVFHCLTVSGQQVYEMISIDDLNTRVRLFLHEKKELNENEVNSTDPTVSFFNLSDRHLSKPEKPGIYTFRTSAAPSDNYLMIQNGNSYELLELTPVSEAIKKVIGFLEKNKATDESIIIYLNQLFEFYRQNRYSSKTKL